MTCGLLRGFPVDAGIQGTREGTFDVIILTRQPLATEQLTFFELAHTPVVILVDPQLGIENLRQEQVEMIFTGDIANWSEVGGPDVDITVLTLPESDLLTQAVREQFLGTQPFSARALALPLEADVIDMVRGLPGSIGYELWAGKEYLDFDTQTDLPGVVNVNGLEPSDPEYPNFVSIGWAYLPERQEYLQPLLKWSAEIVCSELGHLLAQQFGVIPSCTYLLTTSEGQ